MNRSPSFQFYPDKWIAGTMHLDAEAYRAYHRVMCWMWLHAKDQCSMPDADDAWRMATGLANDSLAQCRRQIMHPAMALLIRAHGKLISCGLRKESRKQKEYRLKQSKNAKSRWDKQDMTMSPHMPPHMQRQCSPTPTPTPTPIPKEEEKKAPAARFVRPTPQEVAEYAKSKNIELDGEVFCSFYESNGWKVGRNPMKSWQAAVTGTWKTGTGNRMTGPATPHKLFPNQALKLRDDWRIKRKAFWSHYAVMTAKGEQLPEERLVEYEHLCAKVKEYERML